MIRSHHLQWKFKLWAGKFTWGDKAKHFRVMSTNFLFSKIWWQRPAMFCLNTSSKLSHLWFEFSLKVKVMWSKPGYLFKYFLLYLHIGFSGLPTALLCDISLGFYLEQCLSTVIYFLFYNLVLAYLGYG